MLGLLDLLLKSFDAIFFFLWGDLLPNSFLRRRSTGVFDALDLDTRLPALQTFFDIVR